MSYIIELSFDINKNKNFLMLKNDIINLANDHYKMFSYNNYEIMGKNRRIFRNHYVMTFVFEEDDNNVALFIRKIKKNKNIKIESISYDNCIFKLMYASKKYLNIMEKCKAKEYLEQKRNNKLFKQDSIIMKEMYKKV